MTHPIVLAITGASGAVYARRLLRVLVAAERTVHLVISPSGAQVIHQELGIRMSKPDKDWRVLLEDPSHSPTILAHHHSDLMAPIASGSFLTDGMVICPCSGTTLSMVAHGSGTNLIHRAAEVHLKERRRLILVPRETPLSLVHIDNLRKACEAGATILPAMPGWYHGVKGLDDLVDFVVARILDQLGIDHALLRRWGGP